VGADVRIGISGWRYAPRPGVVYPPRFHINERRPNLNGARRWSIEQYSSVSLGELVSPHVSEVDAPDPHGAGDQPRQAYTA
jgi:hypothetical protein